MALNDIKEITIPVSGTNKAVRKIEDANGNIIWGSQSEYPYRKLEYIKFSGAEKIITDFYLGSTTVNHVSEFSLDDVPSSGSRDLTAVYDGRIADALRRFYFPQLSASGINVNIGNVWSSYASSTPVNEKLKISGTVGKDGSGKPRIYLYLFNEAGTSILSATPLTSNGTGDLNVANYASLGCRTVIDASGNVSYDCYWLGKLYNYVRRQNNSSGTILTNLVPVQRKSDSVCGLYDTVGGNFFPMTGTTITGSAAGPIVDEYWNLTA